MDPLQRKKIPKAGTNTKAMKVIHRPLGSRNNGHNAMIQVYIKAPIWKSESIGINKKIIKDDLLIEITYTKTDGERLYPHVYYMRKDIAKKYPIQEVSHGVKLHIIPIHDLVVLTKDQIEYAQYCQVERIPFRIQYNQPTPH